MSIHNNTLKLEGLKAIARALPDFTYGEYSVENNDAGGQTYDISIDTENSGIKPTQEKEIDITENGTIEVLPDDGFVLSKITVKANVES